MTLSPLAVGDILGPSHISLGRSPTEKELIFDQYKMQHAYIAYYDIMKFWGFIVFSLDVEHIDLANKSLEQRRRAQPRRHYNCVYAAGCDFLWCRAA